MAVALPSPCCIKRNRHRWRRAASGRTVYAYAGGNPISFTDPLGLAPPAFPQGFVDAAAGFGDALSYGLTAWGRNALGLNDQVNTCSASYDVGIAAGVVGNIVATGGAAAISGNAPKFIFLAGSAFGQTGPELQVVKDYQMISEIQEAVESETPPLPSQLPPPPSGH